MNEQFSSEDLRMDMRQVAAEERERFARQDAEPPSESNVSGRAGEGSLQEESSDQLPEVKSRLPLRERTSLVLDAMVQQPPHAVAIYSDRLVRIRHGYRQGAVVEGHTKPSLCGVVARCCRFTVPVRGGDVREMTPPDDVLEDVLNLPQYPLELARIQALAETPQLLADGRVLTQPGLDAASGIYLWPERQLQKMTVPEKPTADDVHEAKEILDDIIVDMKFTDRASRANYIAFWLTPLVRHQIDGCVPVLLISAPMQGSGKGLLTSIITVTATGRDFSAQVANGNDEEMRKMLTAYLRKGQSVIALDNMTNALSGASLASFVTSRVWCDRVLGQTKVEEYLNNAIVIANGNNLRVAGDMVRRCVWCQIDPEVSLPHERTEFVHSPLLQYVKHRRPQIVRALLTIARRWIADGKPQYDVSAVGSFESWCQTVGNILANAGIDGFLENRHLAYEQDDDSTEFYEFLRACSDRFGNEPTTARDIVVVLDPDELPSCVMASNAGHGSVVKKLAKTLAKYSYRRFGQDGIHIVPTKGNANTKRWQVRVSQD